MIIKPSLDLIINDLVKLKAQNLSMIVEMKKMIML